MAAAVITVNVTPSYRRNSSEEELTTLISGDWPLRQQQDLGPYADILVAVARGRVVTVREIEGLRVIEVDPRRRVQFQLGVCPPQALSARGRPSPEQMRWRRGEHWPVKAFHWSIEALCASLGIDSSSSTAEIRGFELSVDDVGNAHVWCPPGKTVTIH